MSPALPPGFDDLFAKAVRRVLAGEPLQPFCDWFAVEMGAVMQAALPVPPGEEADAVRYQRNVARTLWHALPVPANRWRPRPMPKVERNDPCHCGSGRKFKQCCAQFGSIPLPMDQGGLLLLALSHADADMLGPVRVREVPPEALGMAAQAWNEEGQPERTVSVLEPLFERIDRLDLRHEVGFDALVDALQMLGQEKRRLALAERVAGSRDRDLACAARCRLISMAADRGEEAAAWSMFQEARRLYPENPQLWHLEVTLLHAMGRSDEARLRSTLLAAKARKAGLDELAGVLVTIGEQGMEAMYDTTGERNELDDLEDEQWIALSRLVPASFSAEDCRALYELERVPGEDEAEPPTLEVTPGRKLANLDRRWRRAFGATKPMLTSLWGDASSLFDQLPEATRFLQDHPAAWLSIEVLDDLLLGVADLADSDAPAAVLQASRRMTDHALAVLQALAGESPVRIDWDQNASRPLLRLLAQAIALADVIHDDAEVARLAAWGLELNPNDNHGWRMVLVPVWLDQGRFGDALQLMAHYPGDMPPMEHLRALALFALQRRDEAERVLRSAHAEYPRIMDFLLPDVVDAPRAGDGPGRELGGEEVAWEHRLRTRAAWVRTGALAWARGLDLQGPPTPDRKHPPQGGQRPDGGLMAQEFGAQHERRLRSAYPDFARLHGLLTGIAWAPDLLMPGEWMQPVMALRASPPADVDAMNEELTALMLLYNSLNNLVLQTPAAEAGSVIAKLVPEGQADPESCAWAAGFVQAAEMAAGGWRRVKRPVSGKGQGAFATLLRLAAGAPATQDGWRARTDEDQPLLLPLEDAPSVQDSLRLALADLWRVVAPERQARARMR